MTVPLSSCKQMEYNTRYGSLFMVMMTLGMKSSTMLSTFAEHRTVFEKQRKQRFYHVSAYVLACSLSALPLVLMDAFSFGTIFYFVSRRVGALPMGICSLSNPFVRLSV